MYTRICPICGKEFTAAKGNVKYCSPDCRAAGNREKRKSWEDRTDYREKQRLAAQQYREEKAQEERREAEKANKKKQAAIKRKQTIAQKKAREELLAAAEGGDYFALMELAQENGDNIAYWHWYKEYEIDYAESWGRKSTRTVNDISVYNPEFERLVVQSIELEGRIFSTLHGQGERITDHEESYL